MPSKNLLEYTLSIALNNLPMTWDNSIKIPRVGASDGFIESSEKVSQLVNVILCFSRRWMTVESLKEKNMV